MRKPKKSIAILLAVSLFASLFSPFALYADTITNMAQADALKAATLFVGTNNGYNLTGILTRDQGITLALRAQGMEPAVLAQTEVDVAILPWGGWRMPIKSPAGPENQSRSR